MHAIKGCLVAGPEDGSSILREATLMQDISSDAITTDEVAASLTLDGLVLDQLI